MAYICETCGSEFTTPASLGSHQRIHKGKGKAKAGNNEVTVRILVEPPPAPNPIASNGRTSPYKCPDCGGDLTLVGDGVGNYSFRCLRCYERGE